MFYFEKQLHQKSINDRPKIPKQKLHVRRSLMQLRPTLLEEKKIRHGTHTSFS